MSLIDNGTGKNKDTIPANAEYCFNKLFSSSDALYSTDPEILTATSITNDCYREMF